MPQSPPTSPTPQAVDRLSKTKTPAWLYKRVGRYQLQALLGGGSNGKVFRAEDLQLGRPVALKVFSISTNPDGSRGSLQQAVREAKLAAGLVHPHIVHIYEVNEAADVCYIAMELVEGGSLRDLIRGSGPMEYRRACQIIAEVGEALAFAHERGVIHRDVKPANLMLSGGGRCKLADFGLAVLNPRFYVPASSNGVAGTPQFIAPELIKGEPASHKSDIYSLGATLWYVLTGSPPFTADSVPELLDKQLHEPLPDLMSLRSDIPITLTRAIAKAMEKDPAARYDTAEQFASVLRIHTIPVGGSASSLANLGLLTGPEEQAPVRKALLWGGLAAIVCVAVMAIPVYWIANGWLHPAAHTVGRLPADYGTTARAVIASSSMKALTTQPKPIVAAGTIFQATDTATLTNLASADAAENPVRVIVEGVVTTDHPSKRTKYYRIGFSDDDDSDDFGCIYKPELLSDLQKKFGGANGLRLEGKRIRISGHLEMFKKRPAIKIDSADQIEIVKP